MQKPRLSRRQRETLRRLAEQGVSVTYLAKITHVAEGLSLSATYYHISPNRAAYSNAKKKQLLQLRAKSKAVLLKRIAGGETTKDVSEDWGIPLGRINRLLVQ